MQRKIYEERKLVQFNKKKILRYDQIEGKDEVRDTDGHTKAYKNLLRHTRIY